jgi:hypothetical protein
VPDEISAETGATVGADVTVDPSRTVKNVQFKLGNRSVCTDSSAPYDCEILPRGDEVGDQSIEAVVTDSDDRTASDSAATKVGRFETRKLTLHVKRAKAGGSAKARGKGGKGKKKIVRKINGEIFFAQRVTKEQGCATGTVTLTVTQNGNSLFPLTQVPLSKDCGYGLSYKVPKSKKHKFKVEATFGGNSVLTPISATRRFK